MSEKFTTFERINGFALKNLVFRAIYTARWRILTCSVWYGSTMFARCINNTNTGNQCHTFIFCVAREALALQCTAPEGAGAAGQHGACRAARGDRCSKASSFTFSHASRLTCSQVETFAHFDFHPTETLSTEGLSQNKKWCCRFEIRPNPN